ncbi:E3 ubiquitin-protein ligase UHRF1-like [Neocloeon triangulifer]|uniref:E3 ubiquitin-protein ligase UHRF1-like n=1 Tax=Neocloeon triangulifer TaxID=2078957 RepID=UPI00286F2F0E|nr:E3 ubiquitin-protein ligase UHRF1-like [Neocloeon triangulifer]
MLLKLRVFNGKSYDEYSVEISRSSHVHQLLEEASRILNVASTNIDLIVQGQFMTKDSPLLIYKLKDLDVVGVRVKNKQPLSALSPLNKESTTEAVKDDKVQTKPEALKASCSYFEPGDLLYYKNPQTGQWQEGELVSIEETANENESPKSGISGKFSYTIHDGFKSEDLTMPLDNLLPVGNEEYGACDLKQDMVVLAYSHLPNSVKGWFETVITKVEPGRGQFPRVYGLVRATPDSYPNQKIGYMFRTVKMPTLLPRSEWTQLNCTYSLVDPCKVCRGHPVTKCRKCSCVICGGKHDEDKQLICEECEDAFHMNCIFPPLEEIPETDWFCKKCSNNDKKLEDKGLKAKKKKTEKAEESISKIKEGKKDWGRGLATAAVIDKFCVVPKDHFGKIPGVPSGRLWISRLDICSYGVHRPPVGGICGTPATGVQSVCFSGGYQGDYDEGTSFVMSGSGGRDLSNNKRINKQQSFSQELKGNNLALALSCHAELNEENGAKSLDWRQGLPIRVVRGYKLGKISKYAPDKGYRYDGIYKVVRYFKDTSGGNVMWKFELRRDDSEPPPWSSSGMKFMKEMNVGFLEGSKLKIDEEKNFKRKVPMEGVQIKQTSVNPYVLKPEIKQLVEMDVLNKRIWDHLLHSLNLGYPDFIKALAEQFSCQICQEVVKDPFTMNCGHNTCLHCMKKWLKDGSKACCPICQTFVNKTKVEVNVTLNRILNSLLAGYNPKEPAPRPYALTKK